VLYKIYLIFVVMFRNKAGRAVFYGSALERDLQTGSMQCLVISTAIIFRSVSGHRWIEVKV